MKTTAQNAAIEPTTAVESAYCVITPEVHAALAEALDAARDENRRLRSCVERLTASVDPIDQVASEPSTFDVTDYLVAQELIEAALA